IIHTMSSFAVLLFQAEDGIRDSSVTGVQTCALPIFLRIELEDLLPAADRLLDLSDPVEEQPLFEVLEDPAVGLRHSPLPAHPRRSEERRVGKEGRSRSGTHVYANRDGSW